MWTFPKTALTFASSSTIWITWPCDSTTNVCYVNSRQILPRADTTCPYLIDVCGCGNWLGISSNSVDFLTICAYSSFFTYHILEIKFMKKLSAICKAPVCLCSFYLIINFTVVAVYNFVIMKWYHYETNFQDCTTQKLSLQMIYLSNFITTYTQQQHKKHNNKLRLCIHNQ